MSASAVYMGRVGHARSAPRAHAFSYATSMLYLDLDDLDTLKSSWWFGVEAPRPLSFRRSDYLGDPRQALKDAVVETVEPALGFRPNGPVRMLTHVRAFGYVFNPVTFYYCFDARGAELQAIVAEITNTPWGERHRYVVAADHKGARADFDKAFHVSPFLPMGQRYDWSFSVPGDRLGVRMTNLEAGRSVFCATLELQRRPFSARELARVALQLPPMGWKTHGAIYLQALRLRLKKTPFFAHPLPATAGDAQEKLP